MIVVCTAIYAVSKLSWPPDAATVFVGLLPARTHFEKCCGGRTHLSCYSIAFCGSNHYDLGWETSELGKAKWLGSSNLESRLRQRLIVPVNFSVLGNQRLGLLPLVISERDFPGCVSTDLRPKMFPLLLLFFLEYKKSQYSRRYESHPCLFPQEI